MGFRFNKRITILPGVRLNLGLGGVSASVGPRGASVTLGKRGIRGNVGIPGTGLSYSQQLFSSKTQKTRTIKQDQKWQREQERNNRLSQVKLKLNKHNGAVIIKGKDGQEITGRERSLVFNSQPVLIKEWLEDQLDEINGDIDLLQNIFFDSPNINRHPEYKEKQFTLPKPIMPTKNPYPEKPIKAHIPPLNFFTNLFQSKKDAHALKLNEATEAFNEKNKNWLLSCSAIDSQYQESLRVYEIAVKKWQEDKRQHEESEIENKNNFIQKLNVDIQFMEEVLMDVLNQMDWPRETHVDFDIAQNGSEVWLDVDLPEIEDLPQKVASISADGRKLNIKDKTKKQLQLEYADHIHGIGLRLACYVLAALPKAEKIIISGYSQRLNPATGNVDDDYLFSTKFTREGLSQLNFAFLERVNPISTHGLFASRKKMTLTGIFHPIQPFENS